MEAKDAFRFCPRCGTQGKQSDNKLHCPNCGLDTYFNPKPVQSVVLTNDKDEILFVVRAIEPKKGYLDFPGGFVEDGEDFEQTSRREVKEELGIEIGKLEYLSSHKDEYMFQEVNYKVSGVTYTASLPINAHLQPADDVSAVEFYKLEDIPMDRLAFPAMHEIVDRLRSKN